MKFNNSLCILTCLLLCTHSTLLSAKEDGRSEQIAPLPIRFLLSFDDGPSASTINNPTEKVLNSLRINAVQNEIKAIFFVQTQAKGAGGSELGRELLKKTFELGHTLAFHTATSRHANHRFLEKDELDISIKRGVADLEEITGERPIFVRPPFWSFDAKTLEIYSNNHLKMLLTDLSANDGVIYVFNASFRKRSNMRNSLMALRPKWQAGQLPSIDGATPIIVTFHDINRYTARHIEEYLEILVDVAKELEMPTTALPFYDQKDALQKAVLIKVVDDEKSKLELPGIWNWVWSWL